LKPAGVVALKPPPSAHPRFERWRLLSFTLFSSLSPAAPARAAPPPAAAAARGPARRHAPRLTLADRRCHARGPGQPTPAAAAPHPSPAGRRCRSHAQPRPRPPAARSPHALAPMPPLALAGAVSDSGLPDERGAPALRCSAISCSRRRTRAPPSGSGALEAATQPRSVSH